MEPQVHTRDRMREVHAAGINPLSSIPWNLLAPHEKQALRNHDQTLKRLAERGGLSAGEAVAILEDRQWVDSSDIEAYRRLAELVGNAD